MSHARYHSTIIIRFRPTKDLVIAEVPLCKQTLLAPPTLVHSQLGLSEILVLPRPFQTSASVPKTRDEGLCAPIVRLE